MSRINSHLRLGSWPRPKVEKYTAKHPPIIDTFLATMLILLVLEPLFFEQKWPLKSASAFGKNSIVSSVIRKWITRSIN
jgi:hypothetical protein